jgi:hypothetical protein
MVSKVSKKLIFRLRWLVMSDRSRYAYFWARTRENW